MRFNLKVPFAEKDDAKKLGARWDAARKLWYVQDKDDLAPFSRWSPQPHDVASAAPAAAPRAAAGRSNQSAGVLQVGSAYEARPVSCDCPPWELCPQCQPAAFADRAG
jgi:hypothetical protein